MRYAIIVNNVVDNVVVDVSPTETNLVVNVTDFPVGPGDLYHPDTHAFTRSE